MLNIFKYLGTWYGIAKSFNSFQIGQKCVKAEYAQALDTNGSPIKNRATIQNTAVNSIFTSVQNNVNGYAEPIDAVKAPNKLLAYLQPQLFGVELGTISEGKYFVLDTDYNAYSVVYTCTETNYFFFTAKEEYAFLLTRSKKPINATIEIVKSKLNGYFDVGKLIYTVQDCDN